MFNSTNNNYDNDDYDDYYDYDDYNDYFDYDFLFVIFTAIAITGLGGLVTHVLFPLFPSYQQPKSNIESPIDKYLREADERIKASRLKAGGDNGVKEPKPNVNTWCLEYTPIGTFIMNYDPEQGVFGYHTDKKGAAYNILDAVCKRFCAKTDCAGLCVDMVGEEKDIKKKASRGTQVQKRGSGSGGSGGNIAVFKNDQKFNKIIIKKMNSFLYKGSLREFSFLKKPAPLSADPTNTTVSFADFKNKFKNNNL